MREGLSDLIETVNGELGVSVKLNAPAVVPAGLPAALGLFYAATDGLAFPFIEIWPAAKVSRDPGHGWLTFGFDGISRFCLCNPKVRAGRSLDLWPGPSGRAPRGAFDSVLELLRFAYDEYVLSETVPSTLHLREIPLGVQPAEVVRCVKRVSTRPTGALLQDIKHLPLAFACLTAADGIRVVRELQKLGVDCHLQR